MLDVAFDVLEVSDAGAPEAVTKKKASVAHLSVNV